MAARQTAGRIPLRQAGDAVAGRPVLRLLPPSTAEAAPPPRRRVARLLALAVPLRTAGGQAAAVAAGALGVALLAHRWGARVGGGAADARAAAELGALAIRHDAAVRRVAHDLKTPLTALKGQAQLAERSLRAADGPDPARLRARLAAMDAAASAAAARIDVFLAEAAAAPVNGGGARAQPGPTSAATPVSSASRSSGLARSRWAP